MNSPFIILQNIDLVSVALVTAAIGVLGFSVFLNNRKSITNFYFFLFSIFTILWSSMNYFAYQIGNSTISFWLFRLAIALAAWHAFYFFQTFFVFPKDEVVLPRWNKLILFPLVILVSLMNLTPLVFSEIKEIAPDGHVAVIKNGLGIILFSFFIAFCVFGGLFMLFLKMIRSKREDQKKYYFVFIGVLITFLLIIIFNFILPAFLNNSNFVPFGALFIFPFIAFTAYSILRHKLFNLRVAGTSVLVFLLSIVSFLEVTQTRDLMLILYRSSILFFILIFGMLLIRGVLREVKQREQIEKLAKEIQQSYELEKKAYALEKLAKEELERLDKTKNQYLGFAQHNLRTPLTSMRGYADLLLNGTFGKQNKKTIEVIKKVQALIENQIKEVNEFLDITQFQLGKSVISLKPDVEVEPILEEVVSELKFQVDAKGIYLKLEKPEKTFKIPADRTKLKASLSNIINNAIKYTPKGGVDIKIGGTDKLEITISDTGIGISKENLKTLFGRIFERSEEAKKVATGSGIGLYLASQIIKSHNGKVWAESEGEGKGSVFHIELPLSGSGAPIAKSDPQSSQNQPEIKSPI